MQLVRPIPSRLYLQAVSESKYSLHSYMPCRDGTCQITIQFGSNKGYPKNTTMWGLEINIEVNDFSTLVEVIAPANAGGMLAYWEP